MNLPIFVYGTLMPGFPNYNVYLKGSVEKELPATIKGKMYDIGSFPAVVGGDNIIQGYLIYIKDNVEEILKSLDELESCLYTRSIAEVFLENGQSAFAWVYIWALPTEGLLEIHSGDWASHFSSTLELGDVYATPGALERITQEDIIKAIERHRKHDWGEVCEEDWESNNESVEMGYRILSQYTASNGTVFWIITEADRSATTILLPEEY